MTRRAKAALVVAALVTFGCNSKKQDGPDKVQATPLGKTADAEPKARVEPPPARKQAVKGKALLAVVDRCWAAFDNQDAGGLATCYAKDARMALVDAVALLPGQPTRAGTPAAIIAMAKRYWKTNKARHHLDLVLVNGSNAVVMSRVEVGSKVKTWAAQHAMFNTAGELVNDLHFADEASSVGQLGQLAKGTPYRPAWTKPFWQPAKRIVATNDATEKNNVRAYKAWLRDITAGDLNKVMARVASDASFHLMDQAGELRGSAAVRAMFASYAKAFPTFTLASKKAWGAGDWTVSYTLFKGTNAGALPGMIAKATGRTVVLNTFHITRWQHGKVVRHFVFVNGIKRLAQLYPERITEMKKAALRARKAVDTNKPKRPPQR